MQFGACVLGSLWVASLASAQVSVSEVRFEHPDWNFVPLMDGGTTESIVAFDRNAATAGNQIIAVWYIRDGASTTG
jgi:hypothetical protein